MAQDLEQVQHQMSKMLPVTGNKPMIGSLSEYFKEEKKMPEALVKRVGYVNAAIRDFIHNGFTQYGEQNDVILNYDEFCFVAEANDGTVIGAITGRAYYNEVHIGDLVIAENHRRTGLGRRLVRAVEDAYQDKGYTVVTLSTFGFQAPEFYKKLGYTVEFVRRHINPKLDKYFLAKEL